MYYLFVPDPNCLRRYKEFPSVDAAESYLKMHQRIFRPFVKDKKCSILEKGTDLVIKTWTFD
jgi:hypothetical protein